MGKECEEKGDEFELSLELSIGWRYGKLEEKIRDSCEENVIINNNNINKNGIVGSDFCYGIGDEILNLQRREEIQVMKRQEARKKREEKTKKSRGWNGNLVDRACLEGQKLLGRVEDREREELRRKKLDENELKLSLVTCECGMNSEFLEQSCSAVSDSQKGGSNSDTGSLSRNPSVHLESNESSSHREPEQDLVRPPKPSPTNPHPSRSISNLNHNIDQRYNTCSTSASDKSGNATTSMLCMPCVSTTGNGPNGKTIHGFLYKYTNVDVKILCVYHGTSFSPVEFIEHAGGVDVSHLLRHIIIVPTAFGC